MKIGPSHYRRSSQLEEYDIDEKTTVSQESTKKCLKEAICRIQIKRSVLIATTIQEEEEVTTFANLYA